MPLPDRQKPPPIGLSIPWSRHPVSASSIPEPPLESVLARHRAWQGSALRTQSVPAMPPWWPICNARLILLSGRSVITAIEIAIAQRVQRLGRYGVILQLSGQLQRIVDVFLSFVFPAHGRQNIAVARLGLRHQPSAVIELAGISGPLPAAPYGRPTSLGGEKRTHAARLPAAPDLSLAARRPPAPSGTATVQRHTVPALRWSPPGCAATRSHRRQLQPVADLERLLKISQSVLVFALVEHAQLPMLFKHWA